MRLFFECRLLPRLTVAAARLRADREPLWARMIAIKVQVWQHEHFLFVSSLAYGDTFRACDIHARLALACIFLSSRKHFLITRGACCKTIRLTHVFWPIGPCAHLRVESVSHGPLSTLSVVVHGLCFRERDVFCLNRAWARSFLSSRVNFQAKPADELQTFRLQVA